MKPLLFLLALIPTATVSFAASAQVDPCELTISTFGSDPVYMGSIGYLSVDPKFRPAHYEANPSANIQIVPESEELPNGYWGHKDKYLNIGTEVDVKWQSLSRGAFDRFYGILDLEMVDSFGIVKTASIEIENFIPVNIWQCPAQQAIDYAPFWASVKKGVKAQDEQGKALNLSQYGNVFCYELAYDSKKGSEKLNCQVYSSDTDFSVAKFKGQDLTVIR